MVTYDENGVVIVIAPLRIVIVLLGLQFLENEGILVATKPRGSQ